MKDDRIYLLHVRDAIDRILQYTIEGEQAFFADSKTQDAVVLNLEIIGEAVKNLSAELRNAHPDVPWKRIAGMRDKMIHEYFGVNLQLVFDAVRLELPKLQQKVDALLPDY
jgi:uncharacterized protein with HEPN domain